MRMSIRRGIVLQESCGTFQTPKFPRVVTSPNWDSSPFTTKAAWSIMSVPAAATEFCNQGDRCVLQQMQQHYVLAKGARLLCWKSSCIFRTATDIRMLQRALHGEVEGGGRVRNHAILSTQQCTNDGHILARKTRRIMHNVCMYFLASRKLHESRIQFRTQEPECI